MLYVCWWSHPRRVIPPHLIKYQITCSTFGMFYWLSLSLFHGCSLLFQCMLYSTSLGTLECVFSCLAVRGSLPYTEYRSTRRSNPID
ncbi:hypothetical protein QL093DRAFT_2372125 [Fusarium oxysporum]|nr:hypothetical protein QL093DRAFT_2372125 [Fusarium oxysporum]